MKTVPTTPRAAPDLLAKLKSLAAPGVLGFYTHCEVTAVFAIRKGETEPHNVYTIVVLEHREGDVPEIPEYLTADRITIKSLPDWSFGIQRYVKAIDSLYPALDTLSQGEGWRLSGDRLIMGKAVLLAPRFVPPDQAEPVPLNRLLKNNYWNGSHLFEWADPDKLALQAFFDDTTRLKELSDAVQKVVPIDIAGLSDRLGNLIVQLPVMVFLSQFVQPRDAHDFVVRVNWHPLATPRPLRASVELAFDETITGYVSRPIKQTETVLPMPDGRGQYRGMIWDDANAVLLAATGEAGFITSINFAMHPVGLSEPRVFSYQDESGTVQSQRVEIRTPAIRSEIGAPRQDENGGWTRKRIYKHETERVLKDRLFVQYGLGNDGPDAEHAKALDDVRALVAKHGEEGAWLWDPYLSALDLLETLFHSPHSGADLRGLCAANNRKVNVANFLADERQRLQGVQTNWQGLRLEFRAMYGQAGREFHDRFLIFPRAGQGALAWSLGTSVNSMGKAHHILQQADDGQRVKDAFDGLWNRLSDPAHLVWKHL